MDTEHREKLAKKNMVYVGMNLSQDTHDKLTKIAYQRELTISAFIRQILIDYIQTHSS